MKPRERFCVNFAAIRAAHSLSSLGNSQGWGKSSDLVKSETSSSSNNKFSKHFDAILERKYFKIEKFMTAVQCARRGRGSVPLSWPSSPFSSSSPRSPSPSSSWWRWSRSTREPSSSDWAGCWQEEPGGRGSSSSSPVWMFMRKWTWGLRLLKFHLRR